MYKSFTTHILPFYFIQTSHEKGKSDDLVSNVPASDLVRPIHSGYAEIQVLSQPHYGKGGASWHRYWCVLHENLLYIYQNQESKSTVRTVIIPGNHHLLPFFLHPYFFFLLLNSLSPSLSPSLPLSLSPSLPLSLSPSLSLPPLSPTSLSSPSLVCTCNYKMCPLTSLCLIDVSFCVHILSHE